jgi:hypothetical protein
MAQKRTTNRRVLRDTAHVDLMRQGVRLRAQTINHRYVENDLDVLQSDIADGLDEWHDNES